MNRAGRLQTLLRLRIPSALPYFFGGLRISSGLALIGAVVAEFVAGTGGRTSGLAYEILQSGFQLDIPAHVRRAVPDHARRRRAVRRHGRPLQACARATGTRARSGPKHDAHPDRERRRHLHGASRRGDARARARSASPTARIAAIGALTPEPGEQVIDASGCVIYPGLVSTHHHLFQSVLKGVRAGINSPLLGWLRVRALCLLAQDRRGGAAHSPRGSASSSCCCRERRPSADHHYLFADSYRFDPSRRDLRGRRGARASPGVLPRRRAPRPATSTRPTSCRRRPSRSTA